PKSPRSKTKTGVFRSTASFVSRWKLPWVQAAYAWKFVGGCGSAVSPAPLGNSCASSRPPGLRTVRRKLAWSFGCMLFVRRRRRRRRGPQNRFFGNLIARTDGLRSANFLRRWCRRHRFCAQDRFRFLRLDALGFQDWFVRRRLHCFRFQDRRSEEHTSELQSQSNLV